MMIIISLILSGSLLPHLSFSASVKVGIVNGDKVWLPHSRPYMVSVQKSGKHVCGGFLISNKFVMTATRCKTDEDLTVLAGVHDLTERKHVRRSVKSYYKHDPDLMVLELDENVEPNEHIKTIPIPTRQVKIKVGIKCSVAGWGELTHYGPLSLTLRKANVKIVSDKVCQRQWGHMYNASQMMCVYGEGGSCHGDSGGPLVCGKTAVGVSSFGSENNCNDPDQYNVYLNISAFLPWINKITSNSN